MSETSPQFEKGVARRHFVGADNGFRLRRVHRITNSSEINDLFKNGSKRVGRLMIMWVMGNEKGIVRGGFIAGKRTFSRSVDRSRAKRLMRNSFRLNRNRFQEGTDILMVARKMMLKVKRQSVDGELLKLAGEAGVLKPGKSCKTTRDGEVYL